MTVMIAVTGLMGAGHLARSLLIARALREAGARAVIVNGGREIAHLAEPGDEIMQIPPPLVGRD